MLGTQRDAGTRLATALRRRPFTACNKGNRRRLHAGNILGDPGADSGGEGKSKRAEKCGTTKSKERREEPLGTMSYQTSSKRSPPFCLLIGQKNTKVFWRPFRLSLVPTICPWVSEDLRDLALMNVTKRTQQTDFVT